MSRNSFLNGNDTVNEGIDTSDNTYISTTGDKQGTIQNLLGTGQNAKDSIVYLSLMCIFGIGVFITLLGFIYFWTYNWSSTDDRTNSFIDMIKNIWGIFAPLITLVLGYAFGRHKN